MYWDIFLWEQMLELILLSVNLQIILKISITIETRVTGNFHQLVSWVIFSFYRLCRFVINSRTIRARSPCTIFSDCECDLLFAYTGLHGRIVWTLPLSAVQPICYNKKNRSRNEKKCTGWTSLYSTILLRMLGEIHMHTKSPHLCISDIKRYY